MALQQYNIYEGLTAVRLVAIANQTGTYFNGPLNNGVGATFTYASGALSIDSVVVNVGDRVLLVGQTAGNQNGIYVCQTAGAVGIAAVLVRAGDFQNIEQIRAGQYVSVAAGTVNAGAIYVVVEPLPGHLGIDALHYNAAITSGLGTMATQGSGSVAITGGTITGITDLAIADGGTGASTGPLALTALGVKRAITAAFAGGSTSNAFTATGLAATDIVVATIKASTNSVAITKAVPTANTLTITFSADPRGWHDRAMVRIARVALNRGE